MAKTLDTSVIDAALDKINTFTHLTFCSSQPANYAAIAGVKLAAVTVSASSGTKAAGDVSGRKLTIPAQTAMTPTSNGTVTYATLDDGTTLLAATTVTSQAVTTSQTWNSPAFKVEINQPN